MQYISLILSIFFIYYSEAGRPVADVRYIRSQCPKDPSNCIALAANGYCIDKKRIVSIKTIIFDRKCVSVKERDRKCESTIYSPPGHLSACGAMASSP